jgi:hypothetical protein
MKAPITMQTLIQARCVWCFDRWQEYFWAEDAKLLRWTTPILVRVNQLDADTRGDFWGGKLPRSLFKNLGYQGDEPAEKFLRRIPVDKVVAACRIRQSCDRAWDRLMVRAVGVKRSDSGEIFMGSVRVSEKSYLLKWVATAKRIDRVGMSYRLGPEVRERAERQRDQKFLKALRWNMQVGNRSGEVPDEIDWKKVQLLPGLLVEAWCGWPRPYQDLPALCLFENQALSTICARLLGVEDSLKFDHDVRQAVYEYQLWRRPGRQRIVKAVKFKDDVIVLS